MISTRKALETDADAVYRLIGQLQKREFDPARFHKKFKENVGNHSILYLVATDQDQVIGFLSVHVQQLLHHEDRMAEIQELVVDQLYQRQGIASRLLAGAETELHAMGIPQLEVTCNKKREHARAFYLNTGFDNSHEKFVKKLPI